MLNVLSDDKVSEEEKSKTSKLKLPSGFYSSGTECTGCIGCNPDDFVFEKYTEMNSNIIDESPLPLEQPKKQFTKSITAQPALTTFGQLSTRTNDASRNIFGSVNTSTSDQGLFTQLSFTPTTNETTSIFGNNNIFGGNKTIFSQPKEEPKVTTPADEVKKNFSFTNSLKPSVFGQNIFGQGAAAASTPTSLTATFGNNPIKANEDTGATKSFSFGETMRTTATISLATTTPAATVFSFGRSFNFVLQCGRN